MLLLRLSNVLGNYGHINFAQKQDLFKMNVFNVIRYKNEYYLESREALQSIQKNLGLKSSSPNMASTYFTANYLNNYFFVVKEIGVIVKWSVT